MDEISCSCCESVLLLSTQTTKRLCANFMYQNNGLNIDISLDSKILRNTTVTTYRPFKMCTIIPESLFSFACLNILELNKFPRSITVCPRFNVKTKAQDWKLNYRCISISTNMPTVNNQAINNQLNTISLTPSSMMLNNKVPVMTSAASLIGPGQANPPMSTMRVIPNEQIQQNLPPPPQGVIIPN
ncbi:hypothetical protein PV327_002472 [Microctonus hyperodae]|uniref:DUF4773 domain-containing protein n=1 Tax=Microctonus hyperodae TaxID=165561 RepID=A0AA39FFU7_MICHY|nr:hypothetical protein PV327_002472 [Microctonus hyperodae]